MRDTHNRHLRDGKDHDKIEEELEGGNPVLKFRLSVAVMLGIHDDHPTKTLPREGGSAGTRIA